MRFLSVLLSLFSLLILNGQELPLGYISHFSSSFNEKKIHKDISLPKGASYELKDGHLQLKENKAALWSHIPSSAFIIDNNVFGDFIAEIKIRCQEPLGEDSLRGIFVITGLKDSSNYYYVQINCSGAYFNRVYNGTKELVRFDSSLVIQQNQWLTLNIERNILKRNLSIECKGVKSVFKDPYLVMGYLGFGIQGYSLKVNEIDVWAPTSISRPVRLF